MKKIVTILLTLLSALTSFPQEIGNTVVRKDAEGKIKSVCFSANDSAIIPKSAKEFFTNVLKIANTNEFVLIPIKRIKNQVPFELYQQYYNGIKVDKGYFLFHFNENRMTRAFGNYQKIDGIDTQPLLSKEQACELYKSYLNIKAEDVDSTIVEPIIKIISPKEAQEEKARPVFTYKVYIQLKSQEPVDLGFVDAHTGKVISTEPSILRCSATGTFTTHYYNATRSATTKYSNTLGKYILEDSSRGGGIHTWNGTNYSYTDFQDNDNVWSNNDLGSYNDMALDVHWTLQKIYDYLESKGVNSYDNNGGSINAYIISGGYTHCAYNSTTSSTAFYYGNGYNTSNPAYNPMATVEIIAHEFGHGILFNLLNWTNNDILHEGLSDIVGIIMEKRIAPSSSLIWQTGENVVQGYSCERNFANPTSGRTALADTYGKGNYLNGNNYVKSGVFSRWFYLLSQGGNGTNGRGESYSVTGVGFNLAEQLIERAIFSYYLLNCQSYLDVKDAILSAASSLNNTTLYQQALNAWHAVGVSSIGSLSGVYKQEACTFHGYSNSAVTERSLRVSYPMFVHQGCTIEMKSSHFIDREVTYSGVTPDFWYNDGYGTIRFSIPYSSSNNLLTIKVGADNLRNDEYMYFYGLPPGSNQPVNAFITSLNDGSFQINVITNSDNNETNVTINEIIAPNTWTLDLYEASSGKKIITEKHEGNNYVFKPSNMKKGIYIVQIHINDKIFAEKISIR